MLYVRRGRPRGDLNVLVRAALIVLVAAQLILVPDVVASADVVVTLSGNLTYPDGFTVPVGETWEFDPNSDTTVISSGNIVVEGTLQMRPSWADVDHVITFTGIDESKFVGGGHVPLDTDVGLWVTGEGALVLEGTDTPAWGYEWQAAWDGAEVVAAPHLPGDYTTFTEVAAPSDVPAPNEFGFQSELLNLSRNVRIEGTAQGRTHVFVHSTRPQTVRNVALRFVAPDFSNTDETGRYGIHFHHNMDASRGSLIEGVVIRDAANHSFVIHASHGVTLRNTIAYDVTAAAYWWDASSGEVVNDTNDVLYDSVVAALVAPSPYSPHTSPGIELGTGDNPTIVNSVVVGVQAGGKNNAGYFWPGNSHGVWTFEGNVAHNNKSHGIFVWQNESLPHSVVGFTAYSNAKMGVSHGAYNNAYVYQDLVLKGNLHAVESHALGRASSDGATDTQEWADVATDGGSLLVTSHNPGEETKPARFVECDFGDIVFSEGAKPGQYDFVNCDLVPADFVLDATDAWGNAGAHTATVIRVQNCDGTAYQLTGTGATVDIEAFYFGDAGEADGECTPVPPDPDPDPDPDPEPDPDPDPPPRPGGGGGRPR